MPRIALVALLLLAAAAPLPAQRLAYVAATNRSVIASTEQSMGSVPGHVFHVMNSSSVPIIVFGVTVHSCENIKQWCSGKRTNIRIEPGQRRSVGGVEARDSQLAWNYRWSYSWRADSSDARLIAALREAGIVADSGARGEDSGPVVHAIDTTSPPGIEPPLSREPLTDAERSGGLPMRKDESSDAPTSFRFKVAYGSILGSTMMAVPKAQLTGPCVDPAASAKLERDPGIARTPWRPPVVPAAFGRSVATVRRVGVPSPELLVRWAVDTSGATIPESVRILESPGGDLSVRSCTAVIGGRVTPARDRAGRPLRAWVQMTLLAP